MTITIFLANALGATAARVSTRVLVFCLVATNVSAQGPASGPCAEMATVPAPVAEALDRFLHSTIDPEAPRSPVEGYGTGAVLSVTGPGWRYVRAVGVIAPESDVPMTCDMPYQIGSATKMMTATVLLQLHEEGALSVDDLLSAHLPDTAAALPNGDVITLRQLANHTAGVFDYTNNAPDGTPGVMVGDLSDSAMMSIGYTPAALVAFAVDHGEPTFAPGAEGAWLYSNTGYVLMGQIIERITAKPLESVLEERIFGPLGMSDSFLWSDVPRPHFGLPRSFFTPPFEIESTDWNMSQGWAAGAVISTVDDMSVFIAALLEGQLFDDRTTLDIMQDTVPTGRSLMPQYGIGLIEISPGLWGHGGQTLGFVSDTAYIPQENVSIVAWTNSARSIAGHAGLEVSTSLKLSGIIPE